MASLNSWILALLIGIPSRLALAAMVSLQASNLPARLESFPPLCRWDCEWYIGMIANGYDVQAHDDGQANWAFFPLFPTVARGVSSLLRVSPLTAGVVVSVVSFLIGLALLHDYSRTRLSPNGALFVVAAFAISPFSMYYLSAFTEGLFFVLSMLLLRLVDRRQWWWAAACMGALSAVRPTGFLTGLVALERLWSTGEWRRLALRIPVMLGLGVSGLLAFMAYLAWYRGDPLAFLHVQAAWWRTPMAWPRAAVNFVQDGNPLFLFAALCLLLIVLVIVLLWQNGDRGMAFIIGGNTIPPALTGLGSLQRYGFAGAPLYMALGYMTEHRRQLRPSLLLLLGLGSWWFVQAWLADSGLTM